ncbi:hypothetical protein E4U14_003626 [Claviceps sp. LM454 group G7]|nr:hypothetical protein E4U14_003626 [Claviceps sp. LM454 group G7]
MDDVIMRCCCYPVLHQFICSTSSGLSPIEIQQHSRKPQSVTGFPPLHKLARVYWVEVSWRSEKARGSNVKVSTT